MNRIILLVLICTFLSCKGQNEQKSVTSFEFLSEEVLKTKSKEELGLLRNEVYARKGYVFKSKDLNDFFKKKSWYSPNKLVKISLSDTEKDYLDKIKFLEKNNYSLTNTCESWPYSNLYPLTGEKILSKDTQLILKGSELDDFEYLEKFRNYTCEGKGPFFYKINCKKDFFYILMVTYCTDSEYVFISTNKLDRDDVLEIYGLRGDLWDNINKDFILNRNILELNTIKTEENIDTEKLINKYKLTDTGLIEL
ncbi:YARHG domain-containing protein [Cellulophaga sp. HaHa_2_1]|uniref:YARHG domain-containing protein n=2 Tax=Flavobacteriaceae TaxID=49546 RepID=UPI001C4FB50E|nr:YARHG domain-containing protein [Cellulophaga sp. HaHa_2_1]QXP53199.1 YARHG domain-containing protein [Cellulophaga sp. HaHa_2_1]